MAFAVTELGCAAGVMITASHNPKQDNGYIPLRRPLPCSGADAALRYKVYWDNGAQIIPPHDAGIAASIDANLTPWAEAWNDEFVASHPKCSDPAAAVLKAYTEAMLKLPFRAPRPTPELQITYTAMHGVGHAPVRAAFAAAGLAEPLPVPEQCEPDPDFPTVTYPNPEEGKGALALAMRTADAAGSTLILANDPDADRLAVAVKDGESWRILSGNEIGALFGWWAWRAHSSAGADAAPRPASRSPPPAHRPRRQPHSRRRRCWRAPCPQGSCAPWPRPRAFTLRTR